MQLPWDLKRVGKNKNVIFDLISGQQAFHYSSCQSFNLRILDKIFFDHVLINKNNIIENIVSDQSELIKLNIQSNSYITDQFALKLSQMFNCNGCFEDNYYQFEKIIKEAKYFLQPDLLSATSYYKLIEICIILATPNNFVSNYELFLIRKDSIKEKIILLIFQECFCTFFEKDLAHLIHH